MRVLYPSAKTALLRGQMDLEVDTFRAQLVGPGAFDPADVNVADLSGLIGPAVTLTGIDVTDGVARVNDITFPDIGGATHVTGVVVFKEGSPAPLLSFTDQRADTVPLDIEPTGGDITLTFDYLVKL